ncbi:MAG: hypothetical protein HGA87_06190 [Desulfobulbaceae bacterium]|nr:hypothetical protein [Desulfobulbaceae bacterium]
MFIPQGNVVPFPMHLSKAYRALELANAKDVAMIEVTPPDERGYMNYGPCGVVYGRFSTTKCRKVIAQVNAKTPWIHGIENMIHVSEIDYISTLYPSVENIYLEVETIGANPPKDM